MISFDRMCKSKQTSYSGQRVMYDAQRLECIFVLTDAKNFFLNKHHQLQITRSFVFFPIIFFSASSSYLCFLCHLVVISLCPKWSDLDAAAVSQAGICPTKVELCLVT